jgi:hypothetical protein
MTEQLRTHLRVATAGLVQRDLVAHRDAMWEQAVRVQNRHTPGPPADGTVVVVTDEHQAQAPLWSAALAGSGRVVRVGGDHNSVLHDTRNVGVVARLVAELMGASDLSDRSESDVHRP